MSTANGATFRVSPPANPSAWARFRKRPYLYLALKLYKWRRIVPAQPAAKPVTVVCVANTYYQHPTVPKGDILIHAGDLSPDGSLVHFQCTLDWLKAQPHPIKIVIAGMTDQMMDRKKGNGRTWKRGDRDQVDFGNIIYLENNGVTVTTPNGRQLTVWGSPNSPFCRRLGFQYPSQHNFWLGKMPRKLDILITHVPPYGHLDSCSGCYHLLNEIWDNQPRLHVFGCARDDYGAEWLQFDALQARVEVMMGREEGPKELWHVVKGFVQSWWRPVTEAKTLLVNACITGGFWSMARREPITVVI